MSDTTGWSRFEFGFWFKEINGIKVWLSQGTDGFWWLFVGSMCAVAKRKKFRECQILAHDTARLWSGIDE